MEHEGRHNPFNMIRRSRRMRDISQRQLARKIGLKEAVLLCNWENGKNEPTLRNALKLYLALQTPVEELFRELVDELRLEMIEIEKSQNS